MQNICLHCQNWWSLKYNGHPCKPLNDILYEENKELRTVRPPREFGCILFEPLSEAEKHCNTCKHWQHTDVALTVTWSGCSARSHEHEVLMTRENHYCDKWEERS
jgi:pyruvate-formate lyase-activating enzyme